MRLFVDKLVCIRAIQTGVVLGRHNTGFTCENPLRKITTGCPAIAEMTMDGQQGQQTRRRGVLPLFHKNSDDIMLNLHLQGGEINQMRSDFVTFSPNDKFALTKIQKLKEKASKWITLKSPPKKTKASLWVMAFGLLTNVTVVKIWVTRWCKWLAPHIKDSNGTACRCESSWQVKGNPERSWKDEESTLSLSTWVSMGGTKVEQWGSWRTRWRIFSPCHDGKTTQFKYQLEVPVFLLGRPGQWRV